MEVFVNGCRLRLLSVPSLSVKGSACERKFESQTSTQVGIGQLLSFKIQTFEQAGAGPGQVLHGHHQKIWIGKEKKMLKFKNSTTPKRRKKKGGCIFVGPQLLAKRGPTPPPFGNLFHLSRCQEPCLWQVQL